jgi:hypothetical protein
MKIRITARLAEVTDAVKVPGNVFDVTGVSRPYENREGLLARGCAEVELPEPEATR